MSVIHVFCTSICTMISHLSDPASQNNETPSSGKTKEKKNWKKILIVVIVVFLLFIFGSVFIAYSIVHNYIQTFEKNAGVSTSSLYRQVQTGLHSTKYTDTKHLTVLLLGTDQLANRQGDPILTDTMLLLSLNLDSGQFSAVNFPRDLWSSEYKTKINALYEYGFQRYPDTPEQFPKEVIEQFSGVPITKTVILRLDQVSDLIDILGGVEIDVVESFTDEQFPRSDVDIRTETDPTKLYERVTFVQGLEVMNGERALKYIRSRKSSNIDEGTDDARSRRQQQVISAIIGQLSNPTVVKDPVLLGKLYQFYDQNFSQQFPLIELVEIANRLRTKMEYIQFSPSSLSIQDEEQSGVITHPPIEKYGQWVYEVVNPMEFQKEVKEKLGIERL